MANENVGISILSVVKYGFPATINGKELDFLLMLNEMICLAKRQERRGTISGNHKQIVTHLGLNGWENLWDI